MDGAGHADRQRVAVGEQRREQEVDHRVLADHAAADLGEHPLARIAGELERFLVNTGLPVIAHLRDTQNYANAAFQGKSVFDLPPYLGERDVEDWEPVARWLDE